MSYQYYLTFFKQYYDYLYEKIGDYEIYEKLELCSKTELAGITALVCSLVTLIIFACYKSRPFKVPLSMAQRFQAKYGYNEIFNADGTLRFRKRDKVIFYGRKVLRKVRSLAQISISHGRRSALKRRHEMVMKLTKKWMLHFRKDKPTRLLNREPPAAFLETENFQLSSDLHLPAEVYYLLRSVRVLGHFEKPVFFELCHYMQFQDVAKGDYLFQVGDDDISIYVVQSGQLSVYIKDSEHHEHFVKDVLKGENIYSLLSLHNVLTGNQSVYKTVSAIAKEDTRVIRLPMAAFKTVISQYPDSMIRIVQMILVRLQRVTFMALYNYLSLSNELINPRPKYEVPLQCHKLQSSHFGAPVVAVRPSLHQARHRSLAGVGGGASLGDTYGDSTDFDPLSTPPEPSSRQPRGRVVTSCSLGQEPTEEPPTTPGEIDVDILCPMMYHEISETKQPLTRRSSEPVKQKQFSEIQMSDFEKACQQAGVSHPMHNSPTRYQLQRSHSRSFKSTNNVLNREINFDNNIPSDPIAIKPSAKKKKSYSITEHTFMDKKSEEESRPSRYRLLDDIEIMDMAKKDIGKILHLQDNSNLDSIMSMMQAKSGKTLIKQGELNVGLYFIVTGQIAALQKKIQHSHSEEYERQLFISHPGGLIGALAVLTGEPSFFTFRTTRDSYLVYISKQDFYGLMTKEPKIVLHAGHTVVQRMSSFVRQIDFALDWVQLESGRALFRQGEQSENVYIVLNGRLRSVYSNKHTGKKEFAGEHGRGEIVGLIEVVTQTSRATTIMAVRDTELAQIPEGLLSLIKRLHPQVVTRLIGLLSHKILGSMKGVSDKTMGNPQVNPSLPIVSNLGTIAVFTVDNIPLSSFTSELQIALKDIGTSMRLTSEIVEDTLGTSAMDIVNEYRLSSWLSQQEDMNRIVVYQCDTTISPWTRRCLRQADCLLIVAKYISGGGEMGELEKEISNLAIRAQKELILLRRINTARPNDTVEWLNSRTWCSSHHHIVAPDRMFEEYSEEKYKRYAREPVNRLSDFSRVARLLTGTSVGVVLGGGGARGFAHIGVIEAMMDIGIPVDMVCGTSIGSLIGALWANSDNLEDFKCHGKKWSQKMASLWRKIFDLTYPITSMFSGVEFNHGIKEAFGDLQIEDMKIPYFCITTDITSSRMRIHNSGGVWRYVRASMSLSGYLPPMCDPLDGHLLLDGGYVNNLPADVMKSKGAQTIFAIDVGSQDEIELTNYGDQLSGWWLLWKKWNPWATSIKVPNMNEIQSRLAYVSCVQQLDTLKSQGFMEYIRPPIEKIKTLQFNLFDEITEIGYSHAKELFDIWKSKGSINKLFRDKMKTNDCVTISNKKSDLNDLANLIARIDDLSDKTPILPKHFEQLMSDYDGEPSDDEDDNWSIASEPLTSVSDCDVVLRERAYSAGTTPLNEKCDQFLKVLMENKEICSEMIA